MAYSNWDTTPANNNAAAPDGFPEGMAPSEVNNSARQLMADLATFRDLVTGKGTDIASASALTIPDTGSYFDVTGTTTVTSINTHTVGAKIVLQFDGALTLTHHATNLILPGGANITTAAGDHAAFVEYASGQWRCLWYTKAAFSPDLSYETGAFTPVIQESGSTVGDATYNASFTAGTYTKIGRLVHFSIAIRLTSKGTVTGTSVVTIGGLPYSSVNNIGYRAACSCYIHAGVSMSASTNGFFGGLIEQNTDYVKFRVAELNSDTQEDVQMADITDSLYLHITGSYQTS